MLAMLPVAWLGDRLDPMATGASSAQAASGLT
jgi:hypothetical protein